MRPEIQRHQLVADRSRRDRLSEVGIDKELTVWSSFRCSSHSFAFPKELIDLCSVKVFCEFRSVVLGIYFQAGNLIKL